MICPWPQMCAECGCIGKCKDSMVWPFGRQVPDTALMRFVHLHFPSPTQDTRFLDIGCGEGANARELWRRGYQVFTIDKDPEVQPVVRSILGWHACADILTYELKEGEYDLIYDINTLCHVEEPPLKKIMLALKPGGFFFSICPTPYNPKYIAKGKEFTRLATELEVKQMLYTYFNEVKIYWRLEPDFKTSGLESWIVEARP